MYGVVVFHMFVRRHFKYYKTLYVLPPFQNVSRLNFSKFIYFAMYLDIYIISRCLARTAMIVCMVLNFELLKMRSGRSGVATASAVC